MFTVFSMAIQEYEADMKEFRSEKEKESAVLGAAVGLGVAG